MSKTSIHTYYDKLSVPRNATDDQIVDAYTELFKKYNPNKLDGDKKQQAERILAAITVAYENLIDPVKRTDHDNWIDKQDKDALSDFNKTVEKKIGTFGDEIKHIGENAENKISDISDELKNFAKNVSDKIDLESIGENIKKNVDDDTKIKFLSRLKSITKNIFLYSLAFFSFTFLMSLFKSDNSELSNALDIIKKHRSATPSTVKLIENKSEVLWNGKDIKYGEDAYLVKISYDSQNQFGAIVRNCVYVSYTKKDGNIYSATKSVSTVEVDDCENKNKNNFLNIHAISEVNGFKISSFFKYNNLPLEPKIWFSPY